MNSIMNYRYINAVVLLIAFLCLALFVGGFLMQESGNAVHLVKHGVMLIQAHTRYI